MSDIDNARRLHKILDRLAENNPLDSYDISQLRAALPELPKQKSLKEIYEFVDNAAYGTVRNVWRDDVHGDLAPFLHEVSSQLEGLADAEPATKPALPAGMRLADHEEYGRAVASSGVTKDGYVLIFVSNGAHSSGLAWHYVEVDTLNFVNVEPAHPEFLETEADYEDAPEGTVVASVKASPAMKCGRWWEQWPYMDRDAKTMAGEPRRVLRWGWGK